MAPDRRPGSARTCIAVTQRTATAERVKRTPVVQVAPGDDGPVRPLTRRYTGRTDSARGPFGPWPGSYSTV